MASSSSDNLVEWYKIRDMFFGHNFAAQNVRLALELASSCSHPDAQWLTETCAAKVVTSKMDARKVFVGGEDARSLCFASLLDPSDHGAMKSLWQSAELGYAFAQAAMASRSLGEDSFRLGRLAAVHGERDAFYVLGVCCESGRGCDKNLDKAKENFLRAAQQDHVHSMDCLARLLENSTQRWHWWGRAARRGSCMSFLKQFAAQVESFNSGCGSAKILFVIGRALQGQVNENAGRIFNNTFAFDSWIGPAKQAIAFYELQIKATKDAIKTWLQVGIQFNVVKDVRNLIAKLIWESREEALYGARQSQLVQSVDGKLRFVVRSK
jgi:hypothetical protein